MQIHKSVRQAIACLCSLFLLGPNFLFAQDELTVSFSQERGLYTQTQTVSLSTNLTQASIYYTLDGTVPTSTNGTLYSQAIPVSTTTFIRAAAQNADTITEVFTHTYLFLGDIINQANTISGFPVSGLEFDASLKNDPNYGPELLEGLEAVPSMSIVLNPTDFVTAHGSSSEVPVSMEIIYPDGRDDIQENCGMKRVGGSSFNSPKRNWRLTFRSQYGAGKLRAPIFGPGAADEHDQIALRPGFHGCIIKNGGKDINDQVLRNLQIYMDKDSVGIHGFFAHLYINGAYWGLYNPSERGNNGFAEAYYGGNKEDWDAIKRKSNMDGSITAWNTLNSMANNNDLTDSLHYANIQEYIDIEQFINYILICNYGPHSDVHPSAKNSFAIRDRTKNIGFKFYIWDTEPGLWSDWRYTNSTHNTPPFNNIWYALLTNAEFKIQLADQMYYHTKEGGILSPEFVMAEYERLFAIAQKPLIGEAARWKNKTIYEKIFAERDSNLYSYLPNRTQVLINTYRTHNQYPSIDPVVFNQFGGKVEAGFQLTLENPNIQGTIYFTSDGSDPRAYGGGISSSAQQYIGPISLNAAVTDIRARVLTNGEWSASWPARFYQPQDFSGLLINEMHYHPADSCGSEFIELKNKGSDTLFLSDVYFSEGLKYSFPYEAQLAPDSLLVLAKNADTFLLNYGFLPDGVYEGKLANEGETLILTSPDGLTIDSLRYKDKFPWDTLADGYGPSLELLAASLDNKIAANWATNTNFCGTPRRDNSINCSGSNTDIIISEVMYNYGFKLDGLDAQDWVELYNRSNQDLDISAWQLRDEDSTYILPPGTIISANGFLVLADSLDDFNYVHPAVGAAVSLEGLGFSAKGEQLALFDANACPVSAIVYDNKAPWPKSADGEGFSLMLKNDSLDPSLPTSWLASGNYAGTPAQVNQRFCDSTPPPIIINEIAYRPNTSYDTKDWVELYNPNNTAIDLSGWELHDSQNYYKIPPGTIIVAGGYLVIAQEQFSFFTKYGASLPNNISVVGDLDFGLSGDGEWVALLTDDRCWVDGLKYNDSYPWPLEPDGQGPTLALIDPRFDNALAASWAPSDWGGASLGSPGAANNIPDPCTAYQAFSAGELPLINEIAYNENPAFPTGNWLEIHNPSSLAFDLSDWMLIDEDSVFVFPPGTSISAGGFLLLAEDPVALQAYYADIPAGTPVLGPLGIKFDNGGERLLLYAASRCLIDSLRYNDKYPWPEEEPHDPIIALYQQGVDNADGAFWAAADQDGTPGRENVWDCQAGYGKAITRLWLKANQNLPDGTHIANWTDYSGFGNDAIQSSASDQPQFYADQLNGHGIVRFDGTQDWMKINGLASTLATNSTVFAVFVPRADTDDGYYISTHKGGSNRIKMGHRQNGELIYDDDAVSITSGSYIDKASITAFTIHDAETEIQGYVNGEPGNMWTWPTVNDADRASIGQEFDGQGNDNQTSNHWKGDLAELLVFEDIMGYHEIQAVHSYLNIKYGIEVAPHSHAYYPYKTYVGDLAGIGRNIRQCLNQTKSRGLSDILSVEAMEQMHHEDFLVWGNNEASMLASDSVLNVPDALAYRMNRAWHFAETQEIGKVKLSFDLTGLDWDHIDPRAFVLLVDEDGDFTNAKMIKPLLAQDYTFEFDIENGDYISLGVQDYVLLELKAILAGPWDNNSQLMRDDLRILNILPDTDPYTGTHKLDPSLLQLTGDSAMVDWVLVNLFSAIDTSLVWQEPALLQRDGDVVGLDESKRLLIPSMPGDYFVGLDHRNHVALMSATSHSLDELPLALDFTTDQAAGTNAQKQLSSGVYGLWGGDANGDEKVIFQGAINDPASIFFEVLTHPANTTFARNYVVSGYLDADLNLDGKVIFQGASADVSPVLINVLTHPANATFARTYVIFIDF
ncbi:MAG: lamin tail domain-containing protein [Bacteroidota bacterium]